MTAREKVQAALTTTARRAPEIARAAGTAESTARIHLRALVEAGEAGFSVDDGGTALYRLAKPAPAPVPSARSRPRRCPGSGKVQESTRCQNCEAEFPVTTRGGVPRMRAHLPRGEWTDA